MDDVPMAEAVGSSLVSHQETSECMTTLPRIGVFVAAVRTE